MSYLMGLDIGGTKIAGIVLDTYGREIAQDIVALPSSYDDFLRVCTTLTKKLTDKLDYKGPVGIAIPGTIDRFTGTTSFVSNIPYLSGQPLQKDLETALKAKIYLANDANCAALSESIDGAGKGYNQIFGLVLGTGVGGGLVFNQLLIEGANGLAGEVGHLPLPYRDQYDGPVLTCSCGQKGCIDKTISGPGLERLHLSMTGTTLTAPDIATLARNNDAKALQTLDQFYTTIAKATVLIIHMYDPEIIIVSGGLNALPGLYDKVPAKWGSYALGAPLKTQFVSAQHGALSGRRGAAWLCLKPFI